MTESEELVWFPNYEDKKQQIFLTFVPLYTAKNFPLFSGSFQIFPENKMNKKDFIPFIFKAYC